MKKVDLTNLFIASIVLYSFYLFFYKLASLPYCDINAHISFAESISQNKISYPTNFLLYSVLNIFTGIETKKMVMSVILASSVYFKYFLINKYLKNSSVSKYLIMFVSVLLLFIFSLGNINLYKNSYYLGSFTPTIWHNSTIIVLMPFALLLYYYIIEKRNSFKNNSTIILLIILNAIIKPSFLFVIIPFLVILSLFKNKDQIRFLAFSTFSIILILVQYYIIYTLNLGSLQSEKSGVKISILGFYKVYSRIRLFPIALLIGYLFPLSLVIFNRQLIKKKEIVYAWILVIISMLIFTLFIETGPRKNHGNFYWQIVPSSFILFLVSVNELLTNYYRINKNKILIVVLSLHILYGIFYFYKIIFFNVIF